MTRFTSFERYILQQPIAALNLPALPDDATDIDLMERAVTMGYTEIGTDILALAKVLGSVPASVAEISGLIKE
jgi:hypothetical protein